MLIPLLISITVVALSLFYWYTNQKKKRLQNLKNEKPTHDINQEDDKDVPEFLKNLHVPNEKILILYGSLKGNAKRYAESLHKLSFQKVGLNSTIAALDEIDPDSLVGCDRYVIIVVSTYAEGTAPDNAKNFFLWLEDSKRDQRVPRYLMNGLKFAVFGCGNVEYKSNFNYIARKIHRYLRNLRGTSIVPIGIGNEQEDMDDQFEKWSRTMWRALKKEYEEELERGKIVEEMNYVDESTSSEDNSGEELTDLEDLGIIGMSEGEIDYSKIPLDQLTREMVTPRVRKSLTKQGYKVLGSHSGVKLCRWTKAMLRGRGGCYKHTFYGITSYQCMEMTPSLACANKCVFCWRHHTNPVGTQWKWKVDDPEFLVESAIAKHFEMINTMKGVPGVVPERFEEGTTKVKHCALSLVGEPIIYPHINKFVDLLHEKHISTFMVTNAQFPDKMEDLKPVTQLYVSIDAATPESLKEIDRPLFPDFWERYIASIDALARKGQRTVFRLTLVKEYNMEEIENYAKLVHRGRPDFIEIKGVTYCGRSEASDLSIKNTPFHEEVITFSDGLNAEICKMEEGTDLIYEIASEHQHSLCILLANKSKFYVDEQWNTWIDYPKFHELVDSGASFTSLDYMCPTPHWAIFGSEERGFDPEETKYIRNKTKPPTGGC